MNRSGNYCPETPFFRTQEFGFAFCGDNRDEVAEAEVGALGMTWGEKGGKDPTGKGSGGREEQGTWASGRKGQGDKRCLLPTARGG